MPTHDNLRERRIYGGSLTPVYVAQPTDKLTKAVIQVTYEHHEIHEGKFFYVDHVDLALAAGGTMSLGATIPDTFAHFRHVVSAGGAVHVEVSEGVGFTGGGVEIIHNANRNAADAPWTALSDSVIAGGTVILEYIIASGSGPKAAGGAGSIFEEMITQDNQTYVIEATNLTNGAIAASIVVGFYGKDEAVG